MKKMWKESGSSSSEEEESLQERRGNKRNKKKKQAQAEAGAETREPPVLPGTSVERQNKNSTVCRRGGDPGVDASLGQPVGQKQRNQKRQGQGEKDDLQKVMKAERQKRHRKKRKWVKLRQRCQRR
eukprot:11019718-Karenia_brevis.AAC.1